MTVIGPDDAFPTDTAGLPAATPTETLRLGDGARVPLRILPVAKRIGDDVVRMLAYGGSIPGPCLHVDQGSEITVDVTNDGDAVATVHWHGLRLDNRYDGVPYQTQPPIPVGGTYTYRLTFPDPGCYWYHPHIREDVGIEMGLYGAILVEPTDVSYWPRADRQLPVTLDDVLLEDGRIAPFRRSGPTHTAMGRYGDVMLVNGSTQFSEPVAVGEILRLHLVNTANARLFNVAMPGARMKLIGGDSGRYERETFVEEVLLAPSERAIIDVLFDEAGDVPLEHRTPERTYALGTFAVSGTSRRATPTTFDVLRTDPELTTWRQALTERLHREPDHVLGFTAVMPLLHDEATAPAASYACPMHPEVTATEPGTCPKCGMSLVPVPASAAPAHPHTEGGAHGHGAATDHGGHSTPAGDEHDRHVATAAGGEHGGHMPTAAADQHGGHMPTAAHSEHGAPASHGGHGQHGGHSTGGDGLEWEDLMPDINRATDSANMIWKIVDRRTGAENAAITWSFTVGDKVKIRLVNEIEGSDHPMHHPFHIHGAGRFLVLSRQQVPEANLVWKDTVLVPAGHTVDILLDVSNPGRWMAHCHIAEHNQTGMMFSFDVTPKA